MWRAVHEIVAGLRKLGREPIPPPGRDEGPAAEPSSFFDQEAAGLLSRPHFAYALARAAGLAARFGRRRLTVAELGVANGDGLLNLTALAAQIGAETGISFRVVGFDRGSGLPAGGGYRDHPELWSTGDFVMEDPTRLEKCLTGRAELILGDVEDTVVEFLRSVTEEEPIGFLAVDVDLYSATRSCLGLLAGPPEHYLPAFPMYFDDVSSFFSNPWCGELLAIDEFNAANQLRKIDHDRTLAARPPAAGGWHDRMFICHVLDHARRAEPSRGPQTTDEHRAMLRGNPRGYL